MRACWLLGPFIGSDEPMKLHFEFMHFESQGHNQRVKAPHGDLHEPDHGTCGHKPHHAVHLHAKIETPRARRVLAIIWKGPIRAGYVRHRHVRHVRHVGDDCVPVPGFKRCNEERHEQPDAARHACGPPTAEH